MKTPRHFWPLLGVALCLACSSAAPAAPLTIFTGARLIDGTGQPPVENATIIVEDGRIVTVGRVDPATYASRPDKQIVPCEGMTIIPGLISNHSHLGLVKGGNVSADNFTAENIEKTLHQYEGYGVTAVLSLGVNKDLLYSLRDSQRSDGAGYSGAKVFSADHGIGVPQAAPPIPVGADQIARPSDIGEARQAVRDMAARRTDIVKIWVDDFFGSQNPKMSPEISRAIIDEAHRNNLRVAAHVFHLNDAKQLLRDGLDIVAHSVRDEPVDAEFVSLLLQRRAGYIATLALDESQFIYAEQPAWMQSPAFRTAADPKLLATWLSPQYAHKMKANPLTPKNQAAFAMAKRNVKALHDAGALIGFGTDSGATPTRLPGWAEHRELQLLVEAGLSPMEAIVCATRNAARVLREERIRGTLEPGKRADFLVLSANPLDDIANTTRLTAVYNGGRRVEPAFKDSPDAPRR